MESALTLLTLLDNALATPLGGKLCLTHQVFANFTTLIEHFGNASDLEKRPRTMHDELPVLGQGSADTEREPTGNIAQRLQYVPLGDVGANELAGYETCLIGHINSGQNDSASRYPSPIAIPQSIPELMRKDGPAGAGRGRDVRGARTRRNGNVVKMGNGVGGGLPFT